MPLVGYWFDLLTFRYVNRAQVTDGAKLFWAPSALFVGTGEQDVNGGAVRTNPWLNTHIVDEILPCSNPTSGP